LLGLAKAAWFGVGRAVRSAPGVFAACLGVLCFAAVLTWSTVQSPLAQWWLVCVIIFQVLALLWAQGVIARLVLRHLMIGDDGGFAALQPSGPVLRVAATLLLTQIMVAAPLAAIVGVLMYLNRHIGEVSTLLSVPLLAPLAVLGVIYALRFGLAPAPVSLGLSAPLADSWHITEGHVLFIGGAGVMALGPLLAAALVLLLWTGAGPSLPSALVWTVFWMLFAAVQGGLTECLYQRWQSVLRPDMRPSRNRARRLEPILGIEPG
jgi:hypothetical protein